jgi:hypothetical protein
MTLGGALLIRSIWLGLIFLFILVALASFKLTIGSPRPVAATEMPLQTEYRQLEAVAPDAVSNAAMKSDRLQVSSVSTAEPVIAVHEPSPKPPSTASPKIISRHWHEKATQVVVKKRGGATSEGSVDNRRSSLDVDACTSGLDRIKRLMNPAASCKSND